MPPSKIKEILVLHHSHLDVGFTHSQPILWEMQREYLDQALDFLDQTADFPGASLPRWTCEVTEPLMRWLETATPAQVENFTSHLRSGRIGISAMQYNTTPLCNAEQLIRQLYPVRSLRERFGATINTINQHDVNGLPWPMVELMHDSGIELLTMAINLHLGGAPSPRPGIFRWQGASGREVLVMNGNHYTMFDQILYAWDGSLERMAQGLAEYEPVLEQMGYPYDFLYLTTTCSPAAWDNSPPNLSTARLIRSWNEAGRQPIIRYVTPAMLLDRIRQIPREQIPLVRGDWTDFWNFGSASTASETRLNQNAKPVLFAAEFLEACQQKPRRTPGVDSVLRRAWEALNLYDEHTWGYFNTDPDHAQMQTQAHLKKSFAHEAHELADYLLVDQLESLAENPRQSDRPEGVLVVNPSSLARTHFVSVPDSWRQAGMRLRTNRFQYEALHLSQPAPLYGPVELPPFSWKIIPLADLVQAEPDPRIQSGDGWIETPDYRLTYSTASGRILSLFDKTRHWEVLDQSSEFSLFEFVRERTDGLVDKRREAYYNRDLEREKFNLSCWQTGWRSVRERAVRPLGWHVETGPESIRLILSFEAPGVSHLEQAFTLHAASAVIDLDVSFYKLDYRDPESIYFVLPLNLSEGWECLFDTAGTPVLLDHDQIPGTSRDWFTAGSYASLYNAERGVTLYCPDAPMLQAGDFNFGRKHEAIPRPSNPLLLAWPMNNYWNTNFPLTQPGSVRFHYAFQTHGPLMAAQAAARAQTVQVGILAHPVFRDGLRASEGRLLELEGEGVMIEHVKVAADGQGMLVRLHNLSGESVQARIKPGGFAVRAAFRCTPLEEQLGPLPVEAGAVQVLIQPHGVESITILKA